jgi:hypothetical protein
MKKLILLFIVVALTGVFSTINAQTKSELSDVALCAQYKHEIDVLKSEIKTIKVRLKSDKNNTDLKKELAVKQVDLEELKEKKSVIDNAIKSKAAHEKAQKKAEKALEKSEKAAAEAQRVKGG